VPVQPWRFFELIREILFSRNLGSILLAYKDGKLIAGLLLLMYGQTMTYKFGASDRASLKLRPNDLLFWTAIQWGCDHGYKAFDLGRTDIGNTGLRSFKAGWGAKELPLTYFTSSRVVAKQPSKHLAYGMGPIIQRSPLWVCRLLGEIFYKYAG